MRSIIGAGPGLRVGAGTDRIVWEGESDGVRHKVTLWLHPQADVWLWRVEVANQRDEDLPCDAILVQDLGLGDRAS